MAKYNKTLRVRESKKDLIYKGKFGNNVVGFFDYTDGGKKLGDFSQEELITFAVCHDKERTVSKCLIGEIPKIEAKVSEAPKTDK
jgi:hypothetical protein